MPNDVIQVKQLWATRQSTNTVAPELLASWDEFSIDANHGGWDEAREEALAAMGTDLSEWRIIVVAMDRAVVNAAFLPMVVPVGQVA